MRIIEEQIQGQQTFDGAGVDLTRVLSQQTVYDFDPILMLDAFDSTDPESYKAGFPEHPHRGIEAISYVISGEMHHKDSLGNEDTLHDGDLQWMTAGSGVKHSERFGSCERLLGVQVWLNLPQADKMCDPVYHHIAADAIPVVNGEGTSVRVLAGRYGDAAGFQGAHLPLDYFDVSLEPGAALEIPTDPERMTMVFTLVGDTLIDGTTVAAKTAARLSKGDSFVAAAPAPAEDTVRLLVLSAPALEEPIVWHGPIVMNSLADIAKASAELRNDKFLKADITYDK